MRYIILLLALAMFGCGTGKKVVTSDKTETDVTVTDNSATDSIKTSIVTDEKGAEESRETTVTVTEFEHVIVPGNDGKQVVIVVPKKQTQTTNRQGSKTTEKKTEYNQEKTQSTSSQSLSGQEKKNVATAEEPAKDPKRWRYIFYIMLLLVAVIGWLWWKLKPVKRLFN